MRLPPVIAIVGAGLAFVALQLLAPGNTPATPPPAAEVPAAEVTQTAVEAPQAAASPLPEAPRSDEIEVAQDREIKAGMAYLDAIRAIPGAAPLLDDIVSYLQQDDGSNFSVEGLATDAGGLAIIDQSANRQMIKDPEIRAKWETLMKLIAANGEK